MRTKLLSLFRSRLRGLDYSRGLIHYFDLGDVPSYHRIKENKITKHDIIFILGDMFGEVFESYILVEHFLNKSKNKKNKIKYIFK